MRGLKWSLKRMRSCGKVWSLNCCQQRPSVISLWKLYISWLPRCRMVSTLNFLNAISKLSAWVWYFIICNPFLFNLWSNIYLSSWVWEGFFFSAAEKDKETYQSKVVANSSVIEELNRKFNSLALKLEDAEETVRCRKLFHLCFIDPLSMMQLLKMLCCLHFTGTSVIF